MQPIHSDEMDNNNNLPPQNPNAHLGRGVPVEERLARFECRLCHDLVAKPNRHEATCSGTKPYRCEVCVLSFRSDSQAVAHFRLRHTALPRPANFLNPVHRHRPVRRRDAFVPANPAAALGAPILVQGAGNGEPNAAGGEADPPVIPPPIPPADPAGMVDEAAGGDDIPGGPDNVADVAAVVPPIVENFAEGAQAIGGAPAVEQGAGHNVVNVHDLVPPLLRYNLAANLTQARGILGSDLVVIQFVAMILSNPELFQP